MLLSQYGKSSKVKMLNFSNHHSLKRKFQAILTILVSAQEPKQTEALTKFVDDLISGNFYEPQAFPNSQIQAILIGLYNHQDLSNLVEYLPEPEYLTIALAIALCCRGELQPRTLVNKLGSYLKDHPSFCSQLNLANSLAEIGSSRAIARSIISQDSLEFGLYCFLSTPYTWNLVNQGLGHYQISISAIAAAYLGHIPDVPMQHLELATNLSDRLLSAWAGVCDLSNIPINFYPSLKYPAIISLGA